MGYAQGVIAPKRMFTAVFGFLLVLVQATLSQSHGSIDTATTLLPELHDQTPGCKFKGNYIYAAAINLVWQEIKDRVTHEDLRFKSNDPRITHFVSLMNGSPFTGKEIDSTSYYVKCGFGPSIVERINREVALQFPQKAFAPISPSGGPNDLVSYAYIYKKLEYSAPFTPNPYFTFKGKGVRGFRADELRQKKAVEVLSYHSRNKFIARIKLKDTTDELIVAKGFSMSTPTGVLDSIRLFHLKSGQTLGNDDVFGMPELHVDYDHSFEDLVGLEFLNRKLHGYSIGVFRQKIRFDLDHAGVRMENEALMVGMGGIPKVNRVLLLDQSYWVIMKRRNSTVPYLVVGINNTAFMAPADDRIVKTIKR